MSSGTVTAQLTSTLQLFEQIRYTLWQASIGRNSAYWWKSSCCRS